MLREVKEICFYLLINIIRSVSSLLSIVFVINTFINRPFLWLVFGPLLEVRRTTKKKRFFENGNYDLPETRENKIYTTFSNMSVDGHTMFSSTTALKGIYLCSGRVKGHHRRCVRRQFVGSRIRKHTRKKGFSPK